MSVFYPFAVHDLMGLFGTNGMKLQAHFVPYACIYFVKCHTKKLLVTFVVLGKKWHMKIKTILMKLMIPKQFCCDSYSDLCTPQSPLQSAAGVDLRMSGSVNAFVML